MILMNSNNKSTKTIFLSFLIVTFAGIFSVSSFQLMQSVKAQDFDVPDISCIGVFPCSGNEIGNSVTDNSVNDSFNDNSDNSVTISDSFNTDNTNECANTSGSQTQENTTNSTEEMSPQGNTCSITDSPPNFPPSTLSLASLD